MTAFGPPASISLREMTKRDERDRAEDEATPAAPGQERSHAVEDYLKAIRRLQRESAPVSTSALAELLDRSPASVTNMIKSLAQRGLVVHEPYHGVQLSPDGEREALRIIRRHRVIEAYLIERLGYSWDRVHAEAERLEHAASDELVERMAIVLGHPDLDPHGSPIPTAQGEVAEVEHTPLSDAPVGSKAIVREVSDADEARLRYLAELELYPGTWIEIVAREPFGGPIRLRVGEEERSLGRALAASIRVEIHSAHGGSSPR